MRHSNSGRKFSRTPSHRKALMRNLAKALIIHGRITTTEMKAKELRRMVEPLVTLAKANTIAARRRAYRELNDLKLVKRLFDVIGPAYAGVAGGYTRVLKLAMPRKGDNAPMAVIEFVQHGTAAAAPKAARPEAPRTEAAPVQPEAAQPEAPETVAAPAQPEAAQPEAPETVATPAQPEAAQPEAPETVATPEQPEAAQPEAPKAEAAPEQPEAAQPEAPKAEETKGDEALKA